MIFQKAPQYFLSKIYFSSAVSFYEITKPLRAALLQSKLKLLGREIVIKKLLAVIPYMFFANNIGKSICGIVDCCNIKIIRSKLKTN